jgi:hypothetical protein
MSTGIEYDLTRVLDAACGDAVGLVSALEAACGRAHSDDLARSLGTAADLARELDRALGHARRNCTLLDAETPSLPAKEPGRLARYAWLVPAALATALIAPMCWAAWAYGYDPH